jgi:glutathione transport system ATP-binding protein
MSSIISSSDSSESQAQTPLLRVKDLTVQFAGGNAAHGQGHCAVDRLSFDVFPGKTLAIVGESGSGKSVTAMSLMRLIDYTSGRITQGQILFSPEGGRTVDMVTADDETLRGLRGNRIAMIFQEPMTSLNPVFTVGWQIIESLRLHQQLGMKQARQVALDMLRKVRLPDAEQMLDRYPHQLSGGMRQRVMIAMALACRPQLLIADEPTTALDVTIQAQILNIIREMQRDFGTAVIFITHDMGVVAEMADDVVVMWRAKQVESGSVKDIFQAASHPYTQTLLASVPKLGSMVGQPLPVRYPIAVMQEDGQATWFGQESVQDTVKASAPLLEVKNLCTRFDVKRDFFGRVTHRVHAVEQVSFTLYPGETLAIVGESGSGKSTIGKTLQQLIEPSAGQMLFRGQDIASMTAAARRRLKQKIQYVFQDPFASLDPRKTVGFSIAEPILTHALLEGDAVKQRVCDLLEKVGLKAAHASRYPHEFSGGQRQRICIARALACDPEMMIADESVSALDVSIQAQIIDLLMELQQKQGLSYLFITHDMAVVEKMSHRVAVMLAGQLVELGSRQQVFESPAHPYTRKLLAAIPVAEPGRRIDTSLMTDVIPSAIRKRDEPMTPVSLYEITPGHFVARPS